MTPLERRQSAISILGKAWGNAYPLDEELDAFFENHDVSRDDRAWITDVVSGTTRFRSRLEWILAQLSDRGAPTGRLKRALLVGMYQILEHERVAPPKVVEETVESIKRSEGLPPSKFANAVLRKLVAQRESWKAWSVDGVKNADERAAFFACPPDWYSTLVADRGTEWTEAFLKASLERPKIHFRKKLGADTEPSVVPQDWSTARDYFIQDSSSQFLVDAFAETLDETFQDKSRSEIRVLDLCASPGGKAIALAWLGFSVQAAEISEKRLPMLHMNVDRLGSGPGKIEVIAFPKSLVNLDVDAIWVDAPCSAFGVIRRHPEIKWYRKLGELAKVERTQKELLSRTLSDTRAKHVLYTVCSVLKREGEELVRSVLADFPRWKLQKTWLLGPQREPFGDGFFGALLSQ